MPGPLAATKHTDGSAGGGPVVELVAPSGWSAGRLAVIVLGGFAVGSAAGWLWGLLQHPGQPASVATPARAESTATATVGSSQGVAAMSAAAPSDPAAGETLLAVGEAPVPSGDPADLIRAAGARARARVTAAAPARPTSSPRDPALDPSVSPPVPSPGDEEPGV